MNKERNSSIELLRVFAIIFIICSHFCVHSGFDAQGMSFSFNKILLQAGFLGNLGVVIFVMISGFFYIKTSFKPSRVLRIMLQTVFYSVTIYIILSSLRVIQFSVPAFIKACFPVIFTQYWFVSTFVVFSILVPFINILLNSFSKKQFIYYLLCLLILWSIIPTFTTQPLESNPLCQFLLYYSIGAFVGKHQNALNLRKPGIWITVASALLLILSTITLNLIAIKIPAFNYGHYFYSRNSILIISLAYGLLLIFTNTEIKTNRLINMAGASTFGIYLIHDNHYLRETIWKTIFNTQKYQESPYLVLYLVFCVVVVFLACGMIDCARRLLLEKPILKPLYAFSDKMTVVIRKQIDKIVALL